MPELSYVIVFMLILKFSCRMGLLHYVTGLLHDVLRFSHVPRFNYVMRFYYRMLKSHHHVLRLRHYVIGLFGYVI